MTAWRVAPSVHAIVTVLREARRPLTSAEIIDQVPGGKTLVMGTLTRLERANIVWAAPAEQGGRPTRVYRLSVAGRGMAERMVIKGTRRR